LAFLQDKQKLQSVALLALLHVLASLLDQARLHVVFVLAKRQKAQTRGPFPFQPLFDWIRKFQILSDG